jgi:hypothetical protein
MGPVGMHSCVVEVKVAVGTFRSLMTVAQLNCASDDRSASKCLSRDCQRLMAKRCYAFDSEVRLCLVWPESHACRFRSLSSVYENSVSFS